MSRKILKEKIHNIEIDSKTYQIIVHFKRIKKLYLRINGKGEITASVPTFYNSAQVNKFLLQHKDWIIKQSARINKISQQKAKHKAATKNQVLYLGKYYDLQINIADRNKIFFTDDALIFQHPEPDKIDMEATRDSWLNRQAKMYLRKKFYELHERLKAYPLPPVMLQVRKKKRSWGTCYPNKKQIILNRELIKAPEVCIEMVIVHELTHLIHPDHSKAFYALFSKFMPDWKERQALLNKTMQLELEL